MGAGFLGRGASSFCDLSTPWAPAGTLADETVLADLKRFNEKGTIFDEVIANCGNGHAV
jgi:hypothetical protein